MDIPRYLRREGRLVSNRHQRGEHGHTLFRELVSPSYAWRNLQWRIAFDTAFAAKRAAHEAQHLARLRDWRANGMFESMRARGLGEFVDRYEAELAAIN